jgi:RimJ/RimL family protein N-acetyltransferase
MLVLLYTDRSAVPTILQSSSLFFTPHLNNMANLNIQTPRASTTSIAINTDPFHDKRVVLQTSRLVLCGITNSPAEILGMHDVWRNSSVCKYLGFTAHTSLEESRHRLEFLADSDDSDDATSSNGLSNFLVFKKDSTGAGANARPIGVIGIGDLEESLAENEAYYAGKYLTPEPPACAQESTAQEKPIPFPRPDGAYEIGYELHQQEWGKGYISEALAGLLEYYFQQLGLPHINAKVNVPNVASAHVLRNVGFVERNEIDHIGHDGRTVCLKCFKLDRATWERIQVEKEKSGKEEISKAKNDLQVHPSFWVSRLERRKTVLTADCAGH